MSKNKKSLTGIVYSTDPDFRPDTDEQEEQATIPAAQQTLRIRLDTKQRAGKAVTLIEGFSGTVADLEELGKKLRNHCGTGGSAKEGHIIVQGDQRDKVLAWLIKNGYSKSKKV